MKPAMIRSRTSCCLLEPQSRRNPRPFRISLYRLGRSCIFRLFLCVTYKLLEQTPGRVFKAGSEQGPFHCVKNDLHSFSHILLFDVFLAFPAECLIQVIGINCEGVSQTHLRKQFLEAEKEPMLGLFYEITLCLYVAFLRL